jgi:hypothetical protein
VATLAERLRRAPSAFGLALALVLVTTGAGVWSIGPGAPLVRWTAEHLDLGPTAHVDVTLCGWTTTKEWGTYWTGNVEPPGYVGEELGVTFGGTLRRTDTHHAVWTDGHRTVSMRSLAHIHAPMGCEMIQ